jgi:hypothetical protein
MRAMLLIIALVSGSVVLLPAAQTLPPARTPGSRLSTQHTCAASLGSGVKSRRTFCDVITAATPAESVSIPVPARTGLATVFFDLHNRFALPVVSRFPGASYTRHEAVIRLIRDDGEVLGRAAVVREFRTTADLFDQLAGGGRPGGVKGVGPGPPEAVRFAIPAGVTVVGIVGERLRVRTATGGDDTYDAPGRPVAIVSNIRLEYRPAR